MLNGSNYVCKKCSHILLKQFTDVHCVFSSREINCTSTQQCDIKTSFTFTTEESDTKDTKHSHCGVHNAVIIANCFRAGSTTHLTTYHPHILNQHSISHTATTEEGSIQLLKCWWITFLRLYSDFCKYHQTVHIYANNRMESCFSVEQRLV